jgi:hypothetical protein
VRSESTVVRQTQGVSNQRKIPSLRSAKLRQAASIVGRYSVEHAVNYDKSILGSGDFSLVRGGTFYPENDQQSIKDKNNAAISQASTSTRKKPYFPKNPFKNFKDFADLNAAAFSHHTIVAFQPRNILEELQQLDEERKEKKSSKFKSKLMIDPLIAMN